MDTVVIINVFSFFLLFFTILRRYRKNKKIQLNDFILIFFALFFPLGIIRLFLGYESVIGYDIFYNEELLVRTSWVVLFFILCYIFGVSLANVFFRGLKPSTSLDFNYSARYLSVFNTITYLFAAITVVFLVLFIRSQGSLSEYFANLESIRQTLSGQMGNFTVIYVNCLVSLYNILIHRKFKLSSKLGIFISILFFMVYGYRGPVISIIIITFFVLQKLGIFKLKLNVKNIFLGGVIVFLFVLSQDVRNIEAGTEPFFVKLLTRFSGIEPVMVIYQKVVEFNYFTFETFFVNLKAFIELPIPRTIMEDKTKPVSLLLTDELFFDIGKRTFSTGGISPTIIGSLIWNFHYLGFFVMILYSFVVVYTEKKMNLEQNSFRVLVLVSFSLYLILSVEYPENFLGVLWMLIIGNTIIFVLKKFLNGLGIK